MDELTRGVVLALVGVLTGGVLVVIGHSIADRRLEQRLKRAVLAEVRQNATVLDTIYAMAPELEPLPRLHVEAWIAAQGVAWSEQGFRALSALYYHVGHYEDLRQLITTRELQEGQKDLQLRQLASGYAHGALEVVEGAKRAAK
jgi:hypothetical protein